MSTNDLNELVLTEIGEIEKAQTHRAETKPVDSPRPSDQLVAFHLQSSAPSCLGAELRRTVINGSIDLYGRLKVRDPIDSIYAMAIVAMHNAVMSSYAEAARYSKTEDEHHLHRAYEGTALLIDLVAARENRRALLDDPKRREEVLQELMRRYGLAAQPSKKET